MVSHHHIQCHIIIHSVVEQIWRPFGTIARFRHGWPLEPLNTCPIYGSLPIQWPPRGHGWPTGAKHTHTHTHTHTYTHTQTHTRTHTHTHTHTHAYTHTHTHTHRGWPTGAKHTDTYTHINTHTHTHTHTHTYTLTHTRTHTHTHTVGGPLEPLVPNRFFLPHRSKLRLFCA
jgi:hypothetical protein